MHKSKVEIEKIKNSHKNKTWERERERVINFFMWENIYRMGDRIKYL